MSCDHLARAEWKSDKVARSAAHFQLSTINYGVKSYCRRAMSMSVCALDNLWKPFWGRNWTKIDRWQKLKWRERQKKSSFQRVLFQKFFSSSDFWAAADFKDTSNFDPGRNPRNKVIGNFGDWEVFAAMCNKEVEFECKLRSDELCCTLINTFSTFMFGSACLWGHCCINFETNVGGCKTY